MLVLGRVSVGVEDELVGAVVRGLQRRAGLNMNQRSCGDVLTFRRVADVHRERSCEDDEGLFLKSMSVTAAPGARFVAPDIPARVRESGNVAQFGDAARRLARLVRPSDPLELVWPDDAKSHPLTVHTDGAAPAIVRAAPSPRLLFLAGEERLEAAGPACLEPRTVPGVLGLRLLRRERPIQPCAACLVLSRLEASRCLSAVKARRKASRVPAGRSIEHLRSDKRLTRLRDVSIHR
jgi:hypothetical protein